MGLGGSLYVFRGQTPDMVAEPVQEILGKRKELHLRQFVGNGFGGPHFFPMAGDELCLCRLQLSLRNGSLLEAFNSLQDGRQRARGSLRGNLGQYLQHASDPEKPNPAVEKSIVDPVSQKHAAEAGTGRQSSQEQVQNLEAVKVAARSAWSPVAEDDSRFRAVLFFTHKPDRQTVQPRELGITGFLRDPLGPRSQLFPGCIQQFPPGNGADQDQGGIVGNVVATPEVVQVTVQDGLRAFPPSGTVPIGVFSEDRSPETAAGQTIRAFFGRIFLHWSGGLRDLVLKRRRSQGSSQQVKKGAQAAGRHAGPKNGGIGLDLHLQLNAQHLQLSGVIGSPDQQPVGRQTRQSGLLGRVKRRSRSNQKIGDQPVAAGAMQQQDAQAVEQLEALNRCVSSGFRLPPLPESGFRQGAHEETARQRRPQPDQPADSRKPPAIGPDPPGDLPPGQPARATLQRRTS